VDHGALPLTLGTTAALSFMGATYWLLPKITGRELKFMGLARVQPYLWFLGMTFLQHQLSHRRPARSAAARVQRRLER
jgi:cytochrome c oxidase subunit 1